MTNDIPAGSDAPDIDEAMGLGYVGGNAAIYARMLAKFADTRAQDVESVRAQLLAGDRATAERTAHSLKGVGATLGLVRVRDAARALEARIREGDDIAALEPALAATTAVLRAAITAIAAARPAAAAAAAGGGAPLASLRPRLAELQTLLEQFDMKALEAVRQLAAPLAAAAGEDAVATLQRSIEEFDFMAALDALAALRARHPEWRT